jgi:Holliday junction DNA helicase RuvB
MTMLDAKRVEVLERIIKHEEEQEAELKKLGFEGVIGWGLSDIPVDYPDVKKLMLAGFIEKRGKRWYKLRNREEAKTAIELWKQRQIAPPIAPPTAAPPTQIPEDLFAPVIGFDEIKDLLKTTLKSEKPTHVLLIGPPSSAKTLMLTEIARLPGAFYCLGGSTTKVGLVDQLFDLQPRYLLLDELEKMNKMDYVALLSLMETGIVKETKHDKTREIRLTTNVYAACNSTRGLPPELLSRFHFKLTLPEYGTDDFVKVAVATLVIREKVPEELAKYIAAKTPSRDIREVVGIARIAKTPEEVDKVIAVKRKYGGEP